MKQSSQRGISWVAAVCAVMLFSVRAWAGFIYPGLSPANVIWPGGTIPFEFDPALTAAQMQTYSNAVRDWELAGNIHFVPHTSQTNWLVFKYDINAVDNVNLFTTPRILTVSLLSRGQICHELGHALGFNHEHLRYDRTNFVTVLTNNLTAADYTNWFTIDPTGSTNGVYDFESVMHFYRNIFAVNPSLDTLQAKPGFTRYQPRMFGYTLSKGDRAAAAFLYGAGPTLTNLVTTAAEGGPGSLRAALYYATDHPGTTIRFNIPNTDPGFSNGVYTIKITGYLPPLVTDGTIIDGSTQPGFTGKPLIVLDGTAIIPEAYAPQTVTGLLIYAANCQVKNLSFQRFNWNGLTLRYADATNNTIAGCWAGLDYTGTNVAPNTKQGILISESASRNIVGGSNVISGNAEYGVLIGGSNTVGNIVAGNYIGTTASGLTGRGNGAGGVYLADGTRGNLIGGVGASARNVISGHDTAGVWVIAVTNNTVQGNYIGLNAPGTGALSNRFYGIYISNGAKSNLVAGNVISGNGEGIRLTDAGTSGNAVQGNFCGTDPSGTVAIPNDYVGVNVMNSATSNTIGGVGAAARNLLSGNWTAGVAVVNAGTDGNVVTGNYIGTDVTGTNALGGFAGVYLLDGARGNIFDGNVVSANFGSGFYISDSGTSTNFIQGNAIGVAADGTTPLGNGYLGGVYFLNGAHHNIVGLGLDGSGTGNVIADNFSTGIRLDGAATVGNTIRGNRSYDNTDIGIELGGDASAGVTANDTGDGDTGPNSFQNYPAVTNAVSSTFSTVIKGVLNSGTNRTYLLDFYSNTNADGSGYGEGQVYLGSTSVTTGSGGSNSFTFTATGGIAGQRIAGTATDAATGDTSEFSLAVTAVSGPAPPSFVGLQPTGTGFVATVWLTIGQSYHIQAATNLGTNPVVWVNLTNFTAAATNYLLVDRAATNLPARFYRVVSP